MKSIPAISLWQPFAAAIRPEPEGKHFETRSWATSYRGPIAIHAAKRPLGDAEKWDLLHDYWKKVLDLWKTNEPHWKTPLVFGAVVSVAVLVDCVQVKEETFTYHPSGFDGCLVGIEIPPSYPERHFGNYAPGREVWILEQITPLSQPVPYRGRQGLWYVSDPVVVEAANKLDWAK